MVQQYQPFVIGVGEERGDGFPLKAEFLGASWSASIPASLPLLTQQELQQASQWLERGFIDRDYARDFGSRLFQTLFQDAIRVGFRTAYEHVAPQDGLRIVLILPQQLMRLPWELMYDAEGEHGFLARSTTAPLVRHFEGLPLPHRLPDKGPLRVLIATASPRGYPPISSGEEAEEVLKRLSGPRMSIPDMVRWLGWHLLRSRSLRDLISRLRHRGLFEVDVLPHTTRENLQQRLIEARTTGKGYHVVHFVGHGQADEGDGQLLLEAEDGSAEAVQSDEFAEMLDEPMVNLAVLNACQTASATRLFGGVAQAILQRGVPAVIGMQVPILDRAAVEFAQEFYGAWAAGEPIEGALAYARRLIRQETPGAAADWGIPVLFMGPVEEGLTLPFISPPIPPARRWAVFLRRAVAALLSLLSTIALLLTVPQIAHTIRTEVPIIRCVYPYPMESGYRFNVVVNRFTVLDEKGSAISSKDGQALAVYFYQQLVPNFDELDLGIPSDIRPPAHTCQIKGSTREERERKAKALAEQINADIIVYGLITDTGEQSSFTPEFYVNYQGFKEEGEEIAGQYRLGKELRVALPFDLDQFTPVSNPALSARIEALSLMTIGLAYYSIDDFEEASNYFLQAERTKGWLNNAGKEVVYLLLGNAAIRRASQEKSIEYLAVAAYHFDKALDINHNYARAAVGKAGVEYLMAIGDPADQRLDTIDLAKLDEAASLYKAALSLDDQPESADIETKVHLGLGKVYTGRYVHALTTGDDWKTPLAQARAELQEVVQEHENGKVRIANLAGHAHAFLGLLARLQLDYDTAVEHYRRAIGLVSPHYQAYYFTRLGEVYVADHAMASAIQSYQEAIRIAEFYGDEESVNEYTTRLNELERAGR